MINSELSDVRDFHQRFGLLAPKGLKPKHLTRRKLNEQAQTFLKDINSFEDGAQDQNMCLMAKSLVDLVYSVKSTAVMMNLPWEALWKEVHRSNMDKTLGLVQCGEEFNIVEPQDWCAPCVAKILAAHAYDASEWHSVNVDVR